MVAHRLHFKVCGFRAALLASTFFCSFTSFAQFQDIAGEANDQALLFRDKAFAHGDDCEDQPNSYYLGPVFEKVFELHATRPNPIVAQELAISSAEWENGVRWNGSIRFFYDRTRERLKANGGATWRPWSEWSDHQDANGQPSIAVATLVKKNGRWFASDLRMTGLMYSSASSNPLVILKTMPTLQVLSESTGRPTTLKQLLVNIDQPSCKDLFTDVPRPSNRRLAFPA